MPGTKPFNPGSKPPIGATRRDARRAGLCLAAALLCFTPGSHAGQSDLDEAVQRYYAGHPADAIEMLKPIALGGDVAAQNLLGNILYGLGQSGQYASLEDPVRWYQMAAAQGSAEASYALGAIFNNSWVKTRRAEDARLAEYYFQQAADRGHARAHGPLMKLAAQNHALRQADSLTYTNSSFSSKQPSAEQPAAQSAKPNASGALARFETSGDPIADAIHLEALLRQLGSAGTTPASQGGESQTDEASLIRLLRGLGANDGMASDLVKLLGHLRTSRELNLVPGTN